MADNKVIGAAVGLGPTVATDEIAGVDHQRVKAEFGADGSATDVSSANPFPVVQTGTPGLPTGASTAAKQPALGTAGAASADVLSVQGVVSMTALKVDGSGVTQPVSGTVTASGPLTDAQLRATAVPVSGTVTASGPLTDAQLRASAVPVDTELPAAAALADGAANPTTPSVGAAGLLWNGTTWDRAKGDVTNGAFVNVKAMIALPAGVAEIGGVNVTKIAGTAASVNSGAKDAGTQRVILASDQTVVPISDNAGSLTVDAPVGTPVFVTVTPSATGGWSKTKYAAQTTTVQTVKATAGAFGGYMTIYNPNTSAAYVQVFDVASATTVTLGTTVPDIIIGIPPGTAANFEATNGVNMALGIKLACTTTATGSTAPTTGLDMTILWK